MSDDTYTLKITGLEKLMKALKEKPPMARIGILGGSTREDSGPTNATIGAYHEFGTSKLPVRSFLRMPLTENLQPVLEASGAFSKDVLAKVVATGSIFPWVQKMAVIAEDIVLEAFDSGGFGKWPAVDMTHKKNHQILVETNQLRDSITTEVK